MQTGPKSHENQPIQVDCVVVGGGIAGLWTMAALRHAGYSVLLLEKTALGDGQTMASQGIIHCGLKYALTGSISPFAKMVQAVAGRWLQALQGVGPVDLRGAHVTAPEQHLLSPHKFFGSMGAIIGGSLFGDGVGRLPEKDWPTALRETGFTGSVIYMREPAVDVASVVTQFHRHYTDCLRVLPAGDMRFEKTGDIISAIHLADGTSIHAKMVVFTAAGANDDYAAQCGFTALDTQRRPLRQVLIKSPKLPPLWAHALTASPKPAFTVTSHKANDGDMIWYLGGNVAEENLHGPADALYAITARAIHDYLPAVDLTGAQWAHLAIDRVEGRDKDGRLPDTPVVQMRGNALFCWPTKLTLAPLLSDFVLDAVRKENINPLYSHNAAQWAPLSPAECAAYPWDSIDWTVLS